MSNLLFHAAMFILAWHERNSFLGAPKRKTENIGLFLKSLRLQYCLDRTNKSYGGFRDLWVTIVLLFISELITIFLVWKFL